MPSSASGILLKTPDMNDIKLIGISPLLSAGDEPATLEGIREDYRERLAPIRKATRTEMAFAMIQLAKDSLSVDTADLEQAGNMAFEANALLQASEEILALEQPKSRSDSSNASEGEGLWNINNEQLSLVRSATPREQVDFLLRLARNCVEGASAMDAFEGKLCLDLVLMIQRESA